jgi:CheY-like chemotaxis protein
MNITVMTVVEDIFFLARIEQVARKLGVTLKSVSIAQATESVADATPSAIILDLNHSSCPVPEIIRALKANPATQAIPTVGFVSHVQSDVIAAARAAGCDLVLARSAFTRQLPDLLRRFIVADTAS